MADATVSAVARPRALSAPHEAGVAAAAAFAVAALAAADGGYFPTAWGWGALVALWLVAAVLLVGTVVRPSALQLIFVGALAALSTWALVSVAWSIDVVDTVLDGHRMLLYLALAAALVLVVRGPAVPAVLGGALAGVAIASSYGLATRVFPDRLGVFDPVAGYRLSEPVGYWNGLGVFAAMGVVLALGFAARGRALVTRGVAGALPVLLLPTLYFTFGRGPWIALGFGIAAAVVLDPRRLQLLAVAVAVGAPAAVAVVAASRYDALRDEQAPLALAAEQGERLAAILAGLAAVGALAALAFALAERRFPARRSVRAGFAGAIALAVVAALAVVFVRYGGPVTLAEDAYDAFDAPPPRLERGDLGSRLFSFSGSYRADVWASAWHAYRDHPVLGAGAGSFEQYWLEDRPFEHKVRDAHSLYLETLAELGPLGLALLLAALAAPVVAALRGRRYPLGPAAFAAYAVYLVHAGVDWDWELPAVTLTAFVCGAALLATGRREERPLTLRPWMRGAAVAATVALAAVAFVTLVGNSAIASSDEAAEAGDWSKAAAEARKAKRWAPWSSEPWERLGEAHAGQGRFALAEQDFREAIEREPRDFELWLGLARATDGAERRAALARARALNPFDPDVKELAAD